MTEQTGQEEKLIYELAVEEGKSAAYRGILIEILKLNKTLTLDFGRLAKRF